MFFQLHFPKSVHIKSYPHFKAQLKHYYSKVFIILHWKTLSSFTILCLVVLMIPISIPLFFIYMYDSFLNLILLYKQCVVLSHFSRVQLFATLWPVARQDPLSMGFSRQEYWSGQPFSSPGDLPDSGSEATSQCLLHWQAGSLPLAPPGKPLQIVISH